MTIDKFSLSLTRPGALFFDRVQLHDEQTGLRSRAATFDSYSEMTERFCLFSAELSVVVCISQSCIWNSGAWLAIWLKACSAPAVHERDRHFQLVLTGRTQREAFYQLDNTKGS